MALSAAQAVAAPRGTGRMRHLAPWRGSEEDTGVAVLRLGPRPAKRTLVFRIRLGIWFCERREV